MPQVIAFIGAEIEALAVAAGEFAGNAAVAAGLSTTAATTIGTVVYNAAYYGIQIGALVGLGALLKPSIPKPEAAAQTIREPIQPPISGFGQARLVEIKQCLYEAKDGWAYDVYADHDGPLCGVLQWWLHDDKVTLTVDGHVNSPDGKKYQTGGGVNLLVQILHREGAPSQTAYSELTSALGSSIWASTARGDGVAHFAAITRPVKSKDFVGAFPNGVPIPTRAAQLQPIYDPRDVGQTQGTRSTYTWSDNGPLELLAYLTDANGGLGLDYDRYILPAIDTWKAAADDCDDAITLKAGGTEKRYRCWVTYRHGPAGTPPADVMKAILASFDGWLGQRGDGALVLRAGKYSAPTVSIAPEHITAYSLQRLVADDDAVNAYDPTYVSVAHDYAEEPTDQFVDSGDISARGRKNTQPLPVPQSPSPGQSSRLAKRALSRSLAPARGWIMTDLAGELGLGERYLTITIEEAGTTLFSGVAEVLEAERTLGQGVMFKWVQADENIDDWIPAVEEGDPAPLPETVVSDPLAAPTIDGVVVFFDSSGDGSTGARLRITATGPDRDDLTWYFRWRVAGDTAWKESTSLDSGTAPSVTLDTDFVPVNASVEVEVTYSAGSGVAADDWSATTTVSTSAAAIAPAAPSITSHAGGAGTYSIGWQNPASSNFYAARAWKAATGAGFGSASDVTGARLAAANSADSYAPTGISAGTYDLWVTAENSSGAQSTPAGPVTVTVT